MPAPILSDPLSAIGGIRHGFFTREGGVSEGIYAGLNVGLGSRDDRDAVMENRRRVAAHLGCDGAPLTTLHQIHSATALTIDAPVTGAPPEADGVVTATPGVMIGALAADCTPVLFADPHARVVGAAHAGWRGAIGGVLEATVREMERAGADRTRIVAAIGPTISQPNYEVGPEFKAQFLAASPSHERHFTTPAGSDRPHFDLPGFVAALLDDLGLGAVTRHSPCTYENESQLFSYRRATHRQEPDYGRQISAIMVA